MVQANSSAYFAAQPIQGIWTQADSFSLGGESNGLNNSKLHVLAVATDQGQFVNLSSFYQSLHLRLKTIVRHFDPEAPEKFVSSLHQLINELATDGQELKLELVAAYQLENQLVVGGCGGASLTLVRGNKLGKILDTGDQVKVVQGDLTPGDILVLCSQKFYLAFPYARLQQLFLDRIGGTNLETIASELVVQLKRASSEAGVGFILNRYIPDSTQAPSTGSTKNKLTAWWQQMVSRRPSSIFIKKPKLVPQINTKALFIGLVLTVIVLGSTSLAFWQRQRQQAEVEFLNRLEPIQEIQAEAEFQSGINILRSRDLVVQAQAELAQLSNQYPEESRFQPRLEEYAQELAQLYVLVSGETRVEPELFHDLSLVESEVFVDKLGLVESRLLLLDSNNNQAFSLGINNKDPSLVVSATALSGARYIAGGGDSVYAWSQNGVISWTDGQTQVSQALAGDPDWARVVGFQVFANNLYVLDGDTGELWRYRPIPNNQYSRERWLAPGVRPDFSNSVDMAIDGEIWVLDRDGSVRRYSRGVGEQISWLGWDESLAADNLVVAGDLIYILERNQNRVLVFEKNGLYLRQYIWQDLGLVTDLAVYEDSLFLVSGSRLYRIMLSV